MRGSVWQQGRLRGIAATVTVVLVAAALVAHARGEDYTCTYKDYDLTKFKKGLTGYDVPGTGDFSIYDYKLGVCESLIELECAKDKATVCQKWDGGKKVLAMDTVTFAEIGSGGGVTMTLTGGANSGSCMKDNSATIAFKCDQSITSKTYDFTFVGSVDCVTSFEISHCDACPGGCGGTTPPSVAPVTTTKGPTSGPSPTTTTTTTKAPGPTTTKPPSGPTTTPGPTQAPDPACQFMDYDINPLYDPSGYETTSGIYTYTLGICGAVPESLCADPNVANCQTWPTDNHKALGMNKPVLKKLNNANGGIFYNMPDGAYSSTCKANHTTNVNLACDQSVRGKLSLNFVSQKDCVTVFKGSHCHACPNGCSETPPSTTPGPSPTMPPPTRGPTSPFSGPTTAPPKSKSKTVLILLFVALGLALCIGGVCFIFRPLSAAAARPQGYDKITSDLENPPPAPTDAPPAYEAGGGAGPDVLGSASTEYSYYYSSSSEHEVAPVASVATMATQTEPVVTPPVVDAEETEAEHAPASADHLGAEGGAQGDEGADGPCGQGEPKEPTPEEVAAERAARKKKARARAKRKAREAVEAEAEAVAAEDAALAEREQELAARRQMLSEKEYKKEKARVRKALKDALPPGWKMYTDSKTGRYFYYHIGTAETSWTHPRKLERDRDRKKRERAKKNKDRLKEHRRQLRERKQNIGGATAVRRAALQTPPPRRVASEDAALLGRGKDKRRSARGSTFGTNTTGGVRMSVQSRR